MKQVWKCDFCSFTDTIINTIQEHEKDCSFNPANKKCYSCDCYGDDGGYYSSIPACDKHLSIIDGEEKGNCHGWEEIKP